MSKFDPSKFAINDVDLSGYVSNADLSNDTDEKGMQGEKLAGLRDFSLAITFDEALTEELITEIAEEFKAAGDAWSRVMPVAPVKYEVPDGRWQAFKHRLKWRLRFWPFRKLKVRYITYAFDAELLLSSGVSSDGSFSISGTAAGPVSKGTETR